MTFLLMCLASYRVWRLIGLDDVTRRPRNWLLDRLEFGAEDRDATVFAQFITCPWCAGFWVSCAVVGVTAQVTNVPMPVLQAAAVSCVVGLIGGNLDD